MTTTEDFWEQLYGREGGRRLWSGRPNAVLSEVVAGLTPGRVLDLGCGEGGDAVWLAQQGWTVTAVDVAPTALGRTAELAAEHGVQVATERHDLATSLPEGPYELVSAQFFQSPLDLPRDAVIGRAARMLAPGGLLLVVDHGAAPPWSEHHDHYFPTVEETLAGFALGDGWTVELAETRTRSATGPAGQTADLIDNVIAVRRAP